MRGVSGVGIVRAAGAQYAIDKAMRHFGLFERDNGQRMPNLAIQVNLVGPEPKPADTKGLP